LRHDSFRFPSVRRCLHFSVPDSLQSICRNIACQLSEIFTSALSDRAFADGCRELADQIRKGITAWATGHHGRHGEIYAVEADGYGNQLFIDDGNAPSLLSLPYLGCCEIDDPLYQRTRAFVLTEDDPYFYHGTAGAGLGGPQSGLEMIWPLGIITL
jgi:meiotically up-regulated gene 157 (Mug157) protein